ncbi:Tyrosine aminotransferase [Diplonema papillatum]|nr:Tyrosine aminotransferase [Diplonema papillatum]
MSAPLKKQKTEGGWKEIKAASAAVNTSNPIRKVVDQMLIKPETTKTPIPLSIGDPCTDGNLLPPAETTQAMIDALSKNTYNGYPPSAGYEASREAVAKKFPGHAEHPVAASDVFLSSGVSHALQMVFDALLEPGDNILLPQPGFSLYKTICDSKGFECNFYPLDPAKNWECDLGAMKRQINARTKAVFINNPSNPCGSNFSKEHVLAILAIAEEARLPIVSDEIYDGVVFGGAQFHSVPALTKTVPSIVVGGIAKMYVVPGWRLGWSVVHDRNNLLSGVRQAMLQLSTLILGPNSVVQGCLPQILLETPPSYYETFVKTLADNAELTHAAFSKIAGLTPIRPQGAMYCMVAIDMQAFPGFSSEIDFSKALLKEQAVMVLPGSCFQMPKYFRVVYTKPADKLAEAYDRIAEFCDKHRKAQ